MRRGNVRFFNWGQCYLGRALIGRDSSCLLKHREIPHTVTNFQTGLNVKILGVGSSLIYKRAAGTPIFTSTTPTAYSTDPSFFLHPALIVRFLPRVPGCAARIPYSAARLPRSAARVPGWSCPPLADVGLSSWLFSAILFAPSPWKTTVLLSRDPGSPTVARVPAAAGLVFASALIAPCTSSSPLAVRVGSV